FFFFFFFFFWSVQGLIRGAVSYWYKLVRLSNVRFILFTTYVSSISEPSGGKYPKRLRRGSATLTAVSGDAALDSQPPGRSDDSGKMGKLMRHGRRRNEEAKEALTMQYAGPTHRPFIQPGAVFFFFFFF
ncbi:hypothetical protein F4811DRAFT_528420, partial [Daldinia bambusicola]